MGYVGQEHGMTTAAPTMLAGMPNAGGATATAKLNGIIRSVVHPHNLSGRLLNCTPCSSMFAAFQLLQVEMTPHVQLEQGIAFTASSFMRTPQAYKTCACVHYRSVAGSARAYAGA